MLQSNILSLVIDTNILITYFWKNSSARKLVSTKNLVLFSPEYALEEINKHSNRIIKEARITKKEFSDIREEIALEVNFIPLQEYKNYLKTAVKVKDAADVDFIALALKFKIPIWSNDKQLKEQNLVRVFTTEEIIKLF